MSDSQDTQDIGIDRREAVKRVSFLLGGLALVGGSGLLQACTKDRGTATVATGANVGTFSAGDIAMLDEIADTILPTTEKSPGAKAAQTGAFMALMVTDTYDPAEQKIFRDGMTALDAACKAANAGKGFMDITPAQRTTLLEGLDKEQHAFMKTKKGDTPTPYFRMMKELTMLGFFTSEIGMTKAMRYIETPGRWDPCVPYVKGETTWAQHA
jgi:Gluconate 2-dehydrogenase subunit 3